MIERIVDGEIFQFPENRLNDFEFWFGTENPFHKPMFSLIDGKVNYKEDTGMCGSEPMTKKALRTRWVSVIVAMQEKCNAIHLGQTEEKKKLLLFGSGKKRGRKRKL